MLPFLAPILTATVGSAVAFCLRIFATIFLVKLFLVTLFVTVLPLALYKLWLIIQGWILTEMMERAGGVLGDPSSITITLTGMAAWAGNLLNIPQAVAVIVSATITGFTLRLFFK